MGLADVLNGVSRNAKIRRYMPDGNIAEGTLRHIDSENGQGKRPEDVRDVFVRVTLRSGFETWWPLAEIARQSQVGEFAIDT
jgi:hypothetical protein